MGELHIFKNAEFGSVRTITVEGEPYFVGKDVAEILGYEMLTYRQWWQCGTSR